MSKYGYGSTPPRTKAESHIENVMGKGMILTMASSPIFILASGNFAGLLALPLLSLAPLAFADSRRKSDEEYRTVTIDTEEDKRLMSLSPRDLAKELSKS
jgi:Na+/serine symporter